MKPKSCSISTRLTRWVAVFVCLGSGAALSQGTFIPLPKLQGGSIELRVAYVRNPRLPEMSASQLQWVLDTARKGMYEHFGVAVSFTQPEILDIRAVFQRFAQSHIQLLGAQIYDFKRRSGDDARLHKAYIEGLGRHKDDLNAQIDYAAPYLMSALASRTYEALGAALVHTQLERLRRLREQRLPDGGRLIDDEPYNEYVYWTSLDLIRLPYEVVITNQLIASAEYTDADVHSAIRGGISNGLTNRNGAARLLTTSVLSTYPFIGEDAATRELRGNEGYTSAEAARYAAYLLVHELGHQVLHLGHPFGRHACVMNPAPMLHFRAWVAPFQPRNCPLAASGAMMPGFVKIPMPRGMTLKSQ